MRGLITLALVLLLQACTAAQYQPTVSKTLPGDAPLPEMKQFARANPVPPRRSNVDIAHDFLDLFFELETGHQLEVFTRFEGPISLRLSGNAPDSLETDLTRLQERLRREAGITITLTQNPAAQITLAAVTRREIAEILPDAACFVAPNVRTLEEFRIARRTVRTSWSHLSRREHLALFIPTDVSPQEMRDCLHEELAQALGPLNDLYRLPNSVFNDDNIHTVLTGFDMLILRVTYAPELKSGMSRDQVARQLPGILARYNPSGQRPSSGSVETAPRPWLRAVHTALGQRGGLLSRQTAARRALRIAEENRWQDHRLGFSHHILGRVLEPSDPIAAEAHFRTADRLYRALPDTELYRAHLATHLAAYAIEGNDAASALQLIEPHLNPTRKAENAALLATLLNIKAAALAQSGNEARARAVRLDSLSWARYGFGTDWTRQQIQRERALRNTRRSG